MSHYAVAVFHREDQNVDEMLAPFDENISVAPYIAFTKKEAIEYGKKNFSDDFLKGKTNQEIWEGVAEYYDDCTDADGNIYTTYNPQSKWDWYEEGGRYCNLLKLKNGKTADSARVSDIDFSDDEKAYRDALRFWDVVVDGAPAEEGEDYFSIYNPEYYKKYYGDRESYAKACAQWSTFAVLTPDGVWHEPGKMGWWGMSNESPEDSKDWHANYHERFIAAADPNWNLTIVDCHI